MGLPYLCVMGGKMRGYFLFYFIIIVFAATTAGKECSLKFPVRVPPACWR